MQTTERAVAEFDACGVIDKASEARARLRNV
jgi:hypothetical protein